MRILILLFWILVSFFLSPAALAVNREQTLPRLLMQAADAVVEPGFPRDWEAQIMALDEDLEITGGLGAERIRGQLAEGASGAGTGEAGAGASGERGTGEAGAGASGESETGEAGAGTTGAGGAETGEAGTGASGTTGTGETGAETSGESGTGEAETGAAASESQTAEAVSIPALASALYTSEQMLDVDYLLSHAFCLDPTCMADGSILNGETFVNKDLKLTGMEEPQVLIYHTHSQEAYADSAPGDPSMTVQGVGEELARILTEQYGLTVLHNTTQFDMMEGELERSSAYSYAKAELEQILEEYPSIQIIIDLHRDGVPDDLHLATEVNGKSTAQIMFFNGLSQDLDGPIDRLPNPYREDNLAFSFQMYIAAQSAYPGFCRDIYLKGYRYNLHFRPRSVLLEVGAQTNTYEEAVNAMEPFADILAQVVLPAR